MSMENQAIEYISPHELKAHPENPRKGDIGVIIESIEANGWYGTIVAQRSTKYALAGNHRLMAAHALNLETVPVYWVDVDDTTARRIMLADNRSGDIATYDDEALSRLLSQVQEAEGTLFGTGFADEDLEALLHDVAFNEPSHQGLQPDIPTVQENAIAIDQSGIRSIIIPLGMDDYNFAVERLAFLRKQFTVETNAEVLLKLLAD
jgi:ParB-like chromosome segregation protein Spo0J